MSEASGNETYSREAQRLALTGYDTDVARHLLLEVTDATKARAFVAALLADGLVSFGDATRDEVTSKCALNIGFSCRALQVLGVADRMLDVLATRSPAFGEGAPARAARCLGDTGKSAVERWEPRFRDAAAAVWIAIHGSDREHVDAVAQELSKRGADGLAGWEPNADNPALGAQAIPRGVDPEGKKVRLVHFGFRDNIAQPRIDDRGPDSHKPGELLLGYVNDEGFDLWTDADTTPDDIAAFLRDGSFGVLRKIEQDERAFDDYLERQVAALKSAHPHVTKDYLKAKLCGRWADGELVKPGATAQAGTPREVAPVRNSARDKRGEGCPFGAHIRRTNPRGDDIAPLRLRTLFRRGMPYGPIYQPDEQPQKRGLMGVFFCAGIEDQFERLLSEWVEKNPMGPPNRGRARDPLIGHHDDPGAEFHIPQPGGAPPIVLAGFDSPFVTTRGTLYALFPSRSALGAIAGAADEVSRAAAAAPRTTAASSAPAADRGGADALEPGGAPSDRFCDIVMEGGVTSGIIYAPAVVELARRYRFVNVGGSSIGAFAAALTAAAEFRRRNGSNEGFAEVDKLPQKLAEEEGGRTLLERLFVPQPDTRRLFEIFIAALNRPSPASRLWWGLRAALRQYRGLVAIVVPVLVAAVLAGPLLAMTWCSSCAGHPFAVGIAALASLIPTLLLTLGVSILGAVAAGIAWDVLRGLVPNGFGLCRGWDEDANASTQDLAGFLHASIQQVAGLRIEGPCLTFKDLWDAPGAPSNALGFKARDAAARSINLEVYTTNLMHGRPYRFPLDEAEDMGRLFFRIEDFRRYFPLPVLLHLQAVAKPYQPKPYSDPPEDAGEGCLEMPIEELPIVVAVRLAMSFPLLISAVPLYAIDYEQAHANRRLAKCWMSDGGLCSNFPIHLFDSFVPEWPTFGISLQTRSETRPTKGVWLPKTHLKGRADSWNRNLDDKLPALSRLGGFVVSLWLAAWRWNDSTMMRMPGVRDRVVRIYLEPGEGGVNIRMSAQQILKLARDYGVTAAREFLAKFGWPQDPGWTEHRWVRFNTLLVALRKRIEGIGAAARMDHHTLPLARQIAQAAYQAPLRGGGEEPLDVFQINELTVLLAALESLEEKFERVGNHEPYRPVPRPTLRVRHPT